MEILKILLNAVLHIANSYPIITFIVFCMVILKWRIAYVNKFTGETRVYDFETTQSQKELRQRSASALSKQSGESVSDKNVKNGFHLESNSWFASASRQKEKK